jgi:ferredoxin
MGVSSDKIVKNYQGLSMFQENAKELNTEYPPLRFELEPADSSTAIVRSGFEPELGGVLRQKGVFVDEQTCIGCKHCAHVARQTFYIEPDYGRSRVIRQDGDTEDLIQEAIDTCPVDCIDWIDYTQLKQREDERQYQVISSLGLPMDKSAAASHVRRQKLNRPIGEG